MTNSNIKPNCPNWWRHFVGWLHYRTTGVRPDVEQAIANHRKMQFAQLLLMAESMWACGHRYQESGGMFERQDFVVALNAYRKQYPAQEVAPAIDEIVHLKLAPAK